MKKILYAAALFLGALLLFWPGSSKAATPKDLEAGKTYHYDLDGNGTKERLRIIQKRNEDYSTTLKVIINGRIMYKTTRDNMSMKVTICDLAVVDKKQDICIQYNGECDGTVSFESIRYTGTGIKRITGFADFTNDNLSATMVDGIYRLNGKKHFYYVVDTPCYNDYFGCYFVDVPGCIRDKSFQILTEDSYAVSTYENGMEHYIYTLAADMNVYASLEENQTPVATLVPGTQFTALRVQKASYAVDDNGLWVQVQTVDKNVTGWMYFPTSGTLAAPVLTNMPIWG